MISLRPARVEDAAAAAALLRRSITRLCTADHGGDPERIGCWIENKTEANVARWIAAHEVDFLLADRDGRLAGVGAAQNCEIRLLYVDPDHRFGGVSSALLSALEAAQGRRGPATLRLTPTITARAFYAARGWRDVAGGGMEKAASGSPP